MALAVTLAATILTVSPGTADAAAERPPCPSRAITVGNTQIENMVFRLMRCTDRNQVFVESFNTWPNPTNQIRRQASCAFRVEKAGGGSTTWDTCLWSAGTPRYSDLYPPVPLARGQHMSVRAAMFQKIRINNIPEEDWPEHYRWTELVGVTGT